MASMTLRIKKRGSRMAWRMALASTPMMKRTDAWRMRLWTASGLSARGLMQSYSASNGFGLYYSDIFVLCLSLMPSSFIRPVSTLKSDSALNERHGHLV